MSRNPQKTPGRPEAAEVPPKPPFGTRFFDKLIIALLFFVILAWAGGLAVEHYAVTHNVLRPPKLKGPVKFDCELVFAWNIGIKANLAGCIISLFIVYLLRITHFAPAAELVAAMAARFGIPLFALLVFLGGAGQDEHQRVFNQWAQFYIVVIYLVSLPLDVWLVLPEKKRFAPRSAPETVETTPNPANDAPGV